MKDLGTMIVSLTDGVVLKIGDVRLVFEKRHERGNHRLIVQAPRSMAIEKYKNEDDELAGKMANKRSFNDE